MMLHEHPYDMWVDLAYVKDAGITDRLSHEGYRYHWCPADQEADQVDVKGWEVVVDELDDGTQVQYKIQSTDEYLVLLKKLREDPP